MHVPDAYDKMPGRAVGRHEEAASGWRARSITDPEIILYDEPTSGLDPEISASINHLMRELAGAGST